MELAKDLMRILFWSWLLISMFILVRRSLRRESSTTASSPLPTLPPSTAMALSERSDPPAAPSRTGSIFDEGAAIPSPATGPARAVAEVVQGISLPCNLVPVANFVPRPGARDVAVFSTTSHPPQTVGQEIGAELRRLGFDLQARHQTEAVATRDGDTLHVEVHSAPDTVERTGEMAFPTATAGSVVVELWTE